MSSPILLLIGAGANVGANVSRVFVAKGYKVAAVSRSIPSTPQIDGITHFQIDVSDPESIKPLFAKVKETLGTPSVVVYNGKHTPPIEMGLALSNILTC
jgi:NAD(P)-dependent dehydrogenase (short-subunit alcohol dehydrogenase family)